MTMQVSFGHLAYRQDILVKALHEANWLLGNETFYVKISNKEKPFNYRYTSLSVSPHFLAKIAKECTEQLKLKTYSYGWRDRFAPALAKVISSDPRSLYINTGKTYGRHRTEEEDIASIVATIIHECFHILEMWAKEVYGEEIYFHHGDNDTRGKENTVQFWVDDLAERMICDKFGIKPPSERKRFTRPSIWSRIKGFFGRIF